MFPTNPRTLSSSHSLVTIETTCCGLSLLRLRDVLDRAAVDAAVVVHAVEVGLRDGRDLREVHPGCFVARPPSLIGSPAAFSPLPSPHFDAASVGSARGLAASAASRCPRRRRRTRGLPSRARQPSGQAQRACRSSSRHAPASSSVVPSATSRGDLSFLTSWRSTARGTTAEQLGAGGPIARSSAASAPAQSISRSCCSRHTSGEQRFAGGVSSTTTARRSRRAAAAAHDEAVALERVEHARHRRRRHGREPGEAVGSHAAVRADRPHELERSQLMPAGRWTSLSSSRWRWIEARDHVERQRHRLDVRIGSSSRACVPAARLVVGGVEAPGGPVRSRPP